MPGPAAASRIVTLATSEAVRFPSVAVRVNSNMVAPSTCESVNMTVLDAASPKDTCGLAGDVWAHMYVRALDGTPAAVPESVTGSPSRAALLDSAWTASPAAAAGASSILTVTESETESIPSVAVRVNANAVVSSTCGASNVVVLDAASPRDACGLAGDVWAHMYVSALDGTPAAVPESVTGSPSYASWRASAWTASPAGPGASSITVTVTRSEAESVPAVAVRVNANVVVLFTCGASNVTVLDAASSRDACGLSGDVWTHAYVRSHLAARLRRCRQA